MAAKVYTDADASLRLLRGKTCAVIGFGSQGETFALNLRDSGARVVVGLPPKSKSRRRARALKFEIRTNSEAARIADCIIMAAPDMRQPDIFVSDLKPSLRAGQVLVFLHGFSIHSRLIEPPADVDVVLVAPAGPGASLRTLFAEGKGVPGLVAVHLDATGLAMKRALAVAKAVGLTRCGVLKTTFREETEIDLFAEQAVLCGGLSALALTGYETLVRAGYQPELAYIACIYEIKAVAELMQRHGIHGMRQRISETAKYGDLTRGPRVISGHTRTAMRDLLCEIQNGAFMREWISEHKSGRRRYAKLLKQSARNPTEKTSDKMHTLFARTADTSTKNRKRQKHQSS